MRTLMRHWRWLVGLVVVAGLVAFAMQPTVVSVEVGTSARGALVVTVDEEGETRVRERYVLSAPVAGRLLRIDLEPGQTVSRGTVVARLRAGTPALLDTRTRAEAGAAVSAARAALGRAEAERRRAETARELAGTDLRRQRELATGQLTTAQAIEAAESAARTADEGVRAAEFAVEAARAQLTQAEARLLGPVDGADGRVLTLTAPIDGVVLKRLRESESVVGAGEPLLEFGNPSADLEIVSDLLSTDAVRVRPGARVFIEQWGGDAVLTARVRRIEPSGFTKVSALGVEEQRVNVVMDFDDPTGAWKALGDGYRVEVRIVMWEADDVLLVPTSALVRQGEAWTVFVLEDGRIRQVPVTIGQRNSESAEIVSGLEAGRQVVLHPGDQVTDGVRAEAR